MDEKEVIESILAGIVNSAQEWRQLLPAFLAKLASQDEQSREAVISELVEVALDKLSEDDYRDFVEEIAISIASMPDAVRHSILISNIVSPKGLSREKAARAKEAMAGALRKSIIKNSRGRDKIIMVVLESVLLMDDDEAEEVVSGIVNSSVRLSGLDYIKYTASWLSVLGSMDTESIRRILALRDIALKGFQEKVIEERKALLWLQSSL